MQVRDINKPINSKTLNETLARKYGTRLDTDSFTLEQLQDARNKIRTKLSQIETNESFGGLPKNETYSKNKLFLDILNAAISERADVAEGKDQDEDGDKDFADVQIARMVKSGMSKAAAIKKVKDKDYNESTESTVQEGSFKAEVMELAEIFMEMGMPREDAVARAYSEIKNKSDFNPDQIRADHDRTIDRLRNRAQAARDGGETSSDRDRVRARGGDMMSQAMKDFEESIVTASKNLLAEGAEDQAELVMAAKDMVDRLTGWMEDTAEMQSESMLELADAIRDEMGQAESDQFVNTVKPALEQLYASMETTRESLTAGVGMLTGEGGAPAPDMGEIPADVEPEEPEAEMEPTTAEDEFAAAAPAAGGAEEAGRARRESRYYKKKAMLETSRRLGALLSKKK